MAPFNSASLRVLLADGEQRAGLWGTVPPQTHDAFRVLYRHVKSSFYGERKSILMTSTEPPAACPLPDGADWRAQRALPDRNLTLRHNSKSHRSCGTCSRSLLFLHGSKLCCYNNSVGNVCAFNVSLLSFKRPPPQLGLQHI